jgi:hypothetical protein
MSRKTVFITFGGPMPNYHYAVDRICNEASSTNWFNEIIGYKDSDLKSDSEFWNKHGQFIESNNRGYGYWTWKSYLIQKSLEKLNDGDILVYADAGCQVNKQGEQRFYEYINMLDTDPNQYGLISFQMNHLPEEYYTKQIIFRELECNEQIRKSGQCIGGIQIIKKTSHSVELINKWVSNMKYHLINDDRSNEIPEFIDNRHDQSIYSCIVKKYSSIKIPDETWYEDWSQSLTIPILARRCK